MERDGVRIGFAINGGDAAQDGAAIKVSDIHRTRKELEGNGVTIANWRVDERDGQKLQVFFVVAPDGLCYYFISCLNRSAVAKLDTLAVIGRSGLDGRGRV